MIHTIIGATAFCAPLLFILWIAILGLIKIEFHGGKRDFYARRPLDAGWSTRRQLGWWEAWAEEKKARLGFRSPR